MTTIRKLISLVALLALIVPLICLSVPKTTSAANILVNGGFETGNFTGWNVTIPPGGAAQVVTRFDFPVPAAGTYFAKEGNYFALLTNGQQDVWTVVSQTFAAGATISGWAFFKTVDFAPWNDECKVEITVSSGGQVIATLFQASVLSVGNFGGTPWTYWSYAFANAGEYTIQARVVNRGDSAVASYVGLDGVSVMYQTQQQLRRPSSMPAPPAAASIVVKNVNVDPGQAYTGQPITISANMANDGDVVGGYVASLKINDKLEQTKLGTVDGHSAAPVNFTISRSQPGTYTIDIGGQKGTFIILASQTTSGPTLSSGVIAILIMFALIISVVVVLMFTFRRPA